MIDLFFLYLGNSRNDHEMGKFPEISIWSYCMLYHSGKLNSRIQEKSKLSFRLLLLFIC